MSSTSLTSAPRLHYLDAMRGIAAMMVIFYHFINWHWSDQLSAQLAMLIFNGRDAVSFFFVLSGFVLTYKYFNYPTNFHLGRFLFHRFFRLYPAFIVTIALNWMTWIYDPSFSETIDKILRLNYGPVFAELAMILYEHNYYVPGWSLGVEMRASLLIPLAFFLTRQRGLVLWFALIILFFVQPPGFTLFLFHFVCGMLLSHYYRPFQQYSWKQTLLYRYRYGFFILLFLLFNVRVFEHIFTLPPGYTEWSQWIGVSTAHYSALATTGVLFWSFWNSNWQGFLNHPWLQYLGRISYGLYLSHWLVIVLTMTNYEQLTLGLGGRNAFSFSLILITDIILSLALAHWLYHYVERPAIRWAKTVWP